MKKTLLLFLTVVFIFTGCGSKTSVKKTEFIFDTVCTITLDNATDSEIDGEFSLCKKYDNLFNSKNKSSEIYKLNYADGKFVEVSADTAEIIKKAVEFSKIGNGAFDISAGRLIDLWDFKSNNPDIPNDKDIKSALGSVGYENIITDGNKIKLKNNSKIDLGGIAKGYIADKLREDLKEKGIGGGIISLGGNIVVFGEKSRNIAIQKPFSENGEYSAIIKISNGSVVTSGIYQRYFKKNGKIYHHILNTADGYPIENELNSVTIISKNSVDGDALSTLCFCSGYENSVKILKQFKDTEAVFITRQNKILTTDGLDVQYNSENIPVIFKNNTSNQTEIIVK